MDYLWAFLVGGALCAIGQLLLDYTKLSPPRILVVYVTAGALLSILGCYGPLVEFAGAGASIPLTGFGHTLAQGAKTAVQEQGWIGIFSGGFTAGAAGVGAAVIFGYLAALLCKPRTKV